MKKRFIVGRKARQYKQLFGADELKVYADFSGNQKTCFCKDTIKYSDIL